MVSHCILISLLPASCRAGRGWQGPSCPPVAGGPSQPQWDPRL